MVRMRIDYGVSLWLFGRGWCIVRWNDIGVQSIRRIEFLITISVDALVAVKGR